MAALHGFTPDEMLETRRVLEVGLAGLAAERASDAHLATMAEEVTEMYYSLDDPQEYLVHDVRFHRAVASASKNPILTALMEMVTAGLYDSRRQSVSRSPDLKRAADSHRKIYQAIRSRKPEDARLAMNQHLVLARRATMLEAPATRDGKETASKEEQTKSSSKSRGDRHNSSKRRPKSRSSSR
jgi:GntR family transcriptional repressor for pyruvate dehydrogenase complex